MNMRLGIFSFLLLFCSVVFSSDVYLWQMYDEQGNSCCLHYKGVDICDPYKPCTKFLHADMGSIAEYIDRVLVAEKGGKADSNIILLKQIQRYIRNALSHSFVNLSYQLSLKRSVPFYHEILAQLKSGAKQSEKKQQPKIDYVYEYLLQHGLLNVAKKHKK